MNPQLEKYINEKKEEMKKQRDEHLISLGLIDESKTKVERILFDSFKDGAKYDSSLKKFIVENVTTFPIDITEDEYQELLKYTSKTEDTQKIESKQNQDIKPDTKPTIEINNDASKKLITLNKFFTVLAIIFLILGIILTGIGIDDLGGYYSDPTLFILGISFVISSIWIFIIRLFIKGFIVIVECAENNRCN